VLNAPPLPEIADTRFQFRNVGDPEFGVGFVDLAAGGRGEAISYRVVSTGRACAGLRDSHVWRDLRVGRARRAFVAAVLHEFRTPLAQMRMFTEMLQLARPRDAGEADAWLAASRSFGRISRIGELRRAVSAPVAGLRKVGVLQCVEVVLSCWVFVWLWPVAVASLEDLLP
jgi:signal transduction histidine kinase